MGMGGGSGGGGGGSGAVSWPQYFMDTHSAWLNDSGSTSLSSSAADAINSALSANPFTGISAYDPQDQLNLLDAEFVATRDMIEALDPVVDWHDYVVNVKAVLDDHVFSSTALDAAEVAFNAAIDAEYALTTLPRFQRGMQDVNAVMSSAYVVGKAILDAEVVRKKATFSSELRLQSYRDERQMILASAESLAKLVMNTMDLRKSTVILSSDVKKFSTVALKERIEQNAHYDESEAKWDLDVLTYGFNFLASGHGGVAGPSVNKATPLQSAIGGMMSGAAVGGMVGWGLGASGAITGTALGLGPIGWGIGIGALLGGALGLFG
jgi:hypothetical protein